MWKSAKSPVLTLRKSKASRLIETNHYQRFPQKYISNEQFITWDEMRSLCISLGYSPQALKNVCQEVLKKSNAIGVELDNLVAVCKGVEFYETFNYAFNQHTSEWNSEVLQTSIYLLARNALTFDELYLIRNAYSFCESQDGKGLKISQQHLLKFFKLCNRIISPLKLMHRIKHMSNKLKVPGRMQLAEALHLALWCENYDHLNASIREFMMSREKTNFGIWKLDNLEDALQPRSTYLTKYLDKECEDEEWTFETMPLEKRLNLLDETLNDNLRLREDKKYDASYAPIQTALHQSHLDVIHSRANGYNYQQRPDTAPAFLRQTLTFKKSQRQEKMKRALTAIHRPETVREWIQHFEEEERKKVSTHSDNLDSRSQQNLSISLKDMDESEQPKSSDKIEERNLTRAMTEAQFTIETAETVANKYIREDLEYLKPGFWRRHSFREDRTGNPPQKIDEAKSTPRRRVNKLPRDSFPSPIHSRCCEASQPVQHHAKVKQRPTRSSNVSLFSYTTRASLASVF